MKNNGQTEENNRDSGVLSNPLSFLRSGYFYWYGAGLYGRGGYGSYWSIRSASTTGSNYLGFNNAGLYPQDDYNRGYGFAVRCVGTSKSFTTLINTSYSMKNCTSNCESNQDSGILSNPLSFLRSSYFKWSSADMGVRGGYGGYWSLRSVNTNSASGLHFHNTYLGPQYNDSRGLGFAVLPL